MSEKMKDGKCPSYPYDDLRTSAIMAKLLLRLSERYGREAFKAVARATGKSNGLTQSRGNLF